MLLRGTRSLVNDSRLNTAFFSSTITIMIEVQHLTKRYGRFTAVNDLSFEVQKGQIVGFLGPNGAGKTTSLRMLTGFLPPTKGSAVISGYDIFRDSVEARRCIGYMPENVPLYDDMRVKEYLKFRGELKGLSGRKLRHSLGDTIDLCGLSDMKRRMIKTLSKGYRQRVGLADALINSPQLLILDEPTNGLDPNQIRSIRELIKRLSDTHTVLLSTHILSEVEMTCDHVIILDRGQIKANGHPKDLVKNMRAAGHITLEVRANSEVVMDKLNELDHIKRVVAQEASDEWSKLSILCDSGTDSRERIANLVNANGWPIRTLHRRSGSLEDVFVELTRKD